jgi:phosphate:Na+ symporter
MYQGVTNATGGVVLAALLLVERVSGIPLLLSLANVVTQSSAGHMALMYLILNLLIALLAIGGLRWAPGWLERLSPPTPEEDLSRPMYLEPEALLSPETAPDLVALEQMRLMRVLEQYLETVRSGGGGPQLKLLHQAAVTLGEEIARFLEELVRQQLAGELAARIISFQRKAETLRALEENVYLFAATLERRGSEELSGRLVEALDTILLTASDALKSKEALDIELLISMTDDRGSTMERLRTRYRVDNPEKHTEVSALHYATTLFERNVWLLRQLALWIREDVKLNAI